MQPTFPPPCPQSSRRPTLADTLHANTLSGMQLRYQPKRHARDNRFREDDCAVLVASTYPPSTDLAPFIARHYVFTAHLPSDFVLIDKVLAETHFVRVLIRGDWSTNIAGMGWTSANQAVLFGPNSRYLEVRCIGGFHVVGMALRSSGWRALHDQPTDRMTDMMMPLSDAWGDDAAALFHAVAGLADDDHADIVSAMEEIVRARIAARAVPNPIDDSMERFEHLSRGESMVRVTDAAQLLHLSAKQFERRCLAAFGMTPKTVLRRSRFLDMAAAMRHICTPSEEDLARLRYYDQSHVNREFRHFIGMTPGQFAQATTPLLDAGLALREQRKAEDAP